MTKTNDRDEIVRALRLLLEPGQITELRVLDAVTAQDRRAHVESGYFDDIDKLADAAMHIKCAKGLYIVPNPIEPALLARASNRLRPVGKEPTTADHNIVVRRWLLVDCDAVRPAGISSTDAEHQASIELAFRIRAELDAEGWPEPIIAASGNGAHLLFRLDLPANDEGLVKRTLEALADRFDTARVTVDRSVHNPARIWKLYGTFSAKGDNTPDRPHRVAKILEVPTNLVAVDKALLDAMVAKPAAKIPQTQRNRAPRTDSFDIDQWIQRHQLDVEGPEPWQGGRRWVFPVCPWNSDHTNRSAYLLQHANGALAAGCHHNGCQGKSWRDLRDVFEPNWRDRRDDSQDQGKCQGPRLGQATVLANLAISAAEFWRTPDGDAFVTAKVGDHRETWPVRSKAFNRWLRRIHRLDSGGAVNAQSVQDALGVLEGLAIFDGSEHAVLVRVAEHDGRVYLDLCNDVWQAVEIDAEGWRIVSEPPVKFRRPKAMLPLPNPQPGGSVADLRQFVNVSDSDWPLVVTWLVAALYPKGPYPVLCFSAEQGSGKSTSSRVLRSLIDPNSAPLRSEPRGPHDLMIAANNGWLVALDNLSHLPVWLSDCICRLSTGGGFSTRTLYENDEETIFNATRPSILNGIEEVIERGDLLDRSILVPLPRIPESRRMPESDFWRAFEEKRGAILGALLTALSSAIKNRPLTRLSGLPRMADFAILATAAEPGLGLSAGEFIAAYGGNRADVNRLAIDGSLIGKFVIAIAQEGDWAGTATELLGKINGLADDAATRQRGWPKTATALSGAIKRLAPNLRHIGIEVEEWREPDRNRRRMLSIRIVKDSCVRSVQTVQNAEGHKDFSDAPDAVRTVEQLSSDESDDTDAGLQPHSVLGDGRHEWTA